MTPTTILTKDRNEWKYLTAVGFTAKPVPRTPLTLDAEFLATEELFQARRDYSLNRPVRVLDFIKASTTVDSLIREHREKGGR